MRHPGLGVTTVNLEHKRQVPQEAGLQRFSRLLESTCLSFWVLLGVCFLEGVGGGQGQSFFQRQREGVLVKRRPVWKCCCVAGSAAHGRGRVGACDGGCRPGFSWRAPGLQAGVHWHPAPFLTCVRAPWAER